MYEIVNIIIINTIRITVGAIQYGGHSAFNGYENDSFYSSDIFSYILLGIRFTLQIISSIPALQVLAFVFFLQFSALRRLNF
jgi:hypothetical protein